MHEQRKQFYTDQKIQGYFLVGLILMEFILVCLFLFYLHNEINNVIENHLYQTHNIETTSWPEIFTLLGVTMSSFVIINILALYLAHLVWGQYVRKTMVLFSNGLDKILALDFSDMKPSMRDHHRLLDLMGRWLNKEQIRNQDILLKIERLSAYQGKTIAKSDHEMVKQILNEYRQLLTDN